MIRIFLSTALILATGIAIAAQKNPAGTKQANNPKASQSLDLAAAANVQAQLQKSIDVKNAQVGDKVVLKTTQSIKQNGEVVVAKGSQLIGRVTEVQRRSENNSTSRIGLLFDRIEGKNLAAPISASVVSITNAAASATGPDMSSADLSGGSRSAASGSAGGSGGLLGGSGGGLLGGVGSTVGSVVNTAANTTGGLAGTAGQTLGAGTIGSGLNGISLMGSANGSANGGTTLISPSKSLRLEKGVMFNVLLSADASDQE